MKKFLFKGSVVHLDIDKLESIQHALKAKFVTEVGILGSKSGTRKNITTTKAGVRKAGKNYTAQTNAEIGLLHEKGSLTQHLPRRSFLLFPLQYKAEGLLAIKNKLWGVFTNPNAEQTMPRLKKAYKDLGMLAERIISASFKSGGFGKWKDISDATKKRKKSSAILIDSHQLERSISSRVVNQ
jgi:hypothetical protein